MPTTKKTATRVPMPAASLTRRLKLEESRRQDRLSAKLAELKALKKQGRKAWDRYWDTVDQIVSSDPPMWRGTYDTEREFIARELRGETTRSVRRNILVASAFAPADQKKYGVAKLEELALYLMEESGASSKLRAVDVTRVTVRIPDAKGEVYEVPAVKASVAEIRIARNARRKLARREAGPLEKAIRTTLATNPALKSVKITVSADEVSFSGVARDLVVPFARTLAKTKVEG